VKLVIPVLKENRVPLAIREIWEQPVSKEKRVLKG
jgi:hypothetical protein